MKTLSPKPATMKALSPKPCFADVARAFQTALSGEDRNLAIAWNPQTRILGYMVLWLVHTMVITYYGYYILWLLYTTIVIYYGYYRPWLLYTMIIKDFDNYRL